MVKHSAAASYTAGLLGLCIILQEGNSVDRGGLHALEHAAVSADRRPKSRLANPGHLLVVIFVIYCLIIFVMVVADCFQLRTSSLATFPVVSFECVLLVSY